MKLRTLLGMTFLLMILPVACTRPSTGKSETSPAPGTALEPFLGRWDLTAIGVNQVIGGAVLAAYREQEVEVAFGSIEIGILTRRIEADQGVRVVPSARAILKSTGPKTPRVTELLRKAIEWQRQLDAGEFAGVLQRCIRAIRGLFGAEPAFNVVVRCGADIGHLHAELLEREGRTAGC